MKRVDTTRPTTEYNRIFCIKILHKVLRSMNPQRKSSRGEYGVRSSSTQYHFLSVLLVARPPKWEI
jgi:hypothetical protein